MTRVSDTDARKGTAMKVDYGGVSCARLKMRQLKKGDTSYSSIRVTMVATNHKKGTVKSRDPIIQISTHSLNVDYMTQTN